MILKIQQQGLRFKVVKSFSIRPLILEAIKKSKSSEISDLYSEASKNLEIEASYIDQGQLFVGLKEPMSEQGQNLIVNLGSVKNISSLNKIETLEVAFEISFPGFGQEQTRISDVILVGSQLVISTISKKPGTMGRIWSLGKGQSQPRLISEFPSLSPEGLAFNSDSKELMVVFDEGEPDKNRYRRFRIKTVEGADDFAMMYEVLTRRYTRALEEHASALMPTPCCSHAPRTATRYAARSDRPQRSFATAPHDRTTRSTWRGPGHLRPRVLAVDFLNVGNHLGGLV